MVVLEIASSRKKGLGELRSSSFVLALVVIGYYASLLVSAGDRIGRYSSDVIGLFLVIGAMALAGVLRDDSVYSTRKIHWLFILIFMSLAPLAQYINGYFPWSYYLDDALIMKAQAVVFCWCAAFSFGGCLANVFSKRDGGSAVSADADLAWCGVPKSAYALIILTLVALVLHVVMTGPQNLFVRSVSDSGSDGNASSQSLSMIGHFVLVSIPLFSCIFLILVRKEDRSRPLWPSILTFFCLLVTVWPPAVSRYMTAAVYGGLALVLVPRRMAHSRLVDFVVIVGIMIVFPAFYAFKFGTLDLEYFQRTIVGALSGTVFCSIDFDAFSLVARIVQYADLNGLTWGTQVFSAIFCFVPRAFLAALGIAKGLPTGEVVATSQGAAYTNLSAPTMSEAYIDFGFFGVVLLALTVSIFLKLLDEHFWDGYLSYDGEAYLSRAVYPVFVTFLVYILRGSLLHTVMRLYGILLVPLAIYVAHRLLSDRRQRDARMSADDNSVFAARVVKRP